jgi:hypothetical protein
MAKDMHYASEYQKATSGANGSVLRLPADPLDTETYSSIVTDDSGSASVNFVDAISLQVYSGWVIGANSAWIGPCKDIKVVSGKVACKR